MQTVPLGLSGTAPLLVAQGGIEPPSGAYETPELPLLYRAIILVASEGNAPTSFDYQSSALLLSYKGIGSNGETRTHDKHRMKVVH